MGFIVLSSLLSIGTYLGSLQAPSFWVAFLAWTTLFLWACITWPRLFIFIACVLVTAFLAIVDIRSMLTFVHVVDWRRVLYMMSPLVPLGLLWRWPWYSVGFVALSFMLSMGKCLFSLQGPSFWVAFVAWATLFLCTCITWPGMSLFMTSVMALTFLGFKDTRSMLAWG